MGRKELQELFKKYAQHGFMWCHFDAWLSILFLIIAALSFDFSMTAIMRFFKELLTVTPVLFSEVVVTKVKPDLNI